MDSFVDHIKHSFLQNNYVVAGLSSLVLLVITLLVFCRKKNDSASSGKSNPGMVFPPTEFFRQKPRFRRRDKVRFYTTKMLRKVKQFKDDVLPGPEEVTSTRDLRYNKKRRASGFSRFLQRQDSEIKRMLKDPPASLLEADFAEVSGSDSMLPAEVMFMLRSVRVFGHFEKPLFFELCKHIVTKILPKGKILFKPGNMEEAIYIVQTGQINLYLVDKKGTEMLLKEVKPGENIYSVMNILDAIRGNTYYKYAVLMRAAMDSTVLLLPSRAFKRIFEDHPESLVRVVQIVMLRLQQVTFMALHQFLGLSTELISNVVSRKVNEELKSLSVYSLNETVEPLNTKSNEAVCSSAPPVTQTTPNTPRRHFASITSIQEDAQEHQNEPREASSPMKRTSSFSSLKTNNQACSPQQTSDAMDGNASSSTNAPPMKRTGSHGKLVNLYGSSVQSTLGGPKSDFEAVLGRVGMDINEAGKISQGVDEDMITFDIPRTTAPPVFEGDYGGLTKEQEDKMLAAARSDLVKLLNLPTPKLLDNILSIDVVPQGRFLARQGDTDSSLVFLVKGILQIRQRDKDKEWALFNCVPGEFVGSLSLLTGEPSFFSVKAIAISYVVIISKLNFYNLIKEHPKIVLPVANSMIQKLSSFVRNIDFALDWTMLEAGKPLYSQNADPDSVYIVLNGRLRAVQMQVETGKKTLGDEFGRGEFVGLVDVLTSYPRTNSVHAVRDTELAQIPEGLLNAIKLHYPQVVSRLMQLLGTRILGMKKKSSAPPVITNSKLERVGHNLGTVAIFPASNSVPIQNFTFELGLALNDIGPSVILTSDIVTKRFGSSVWDSVHEYVLLNWLGYQEDIHRIVLYQCDSYMSEWTKRCVRQADIILIVGCGDQDPAVGKLESQLENMTTIRAQKDLILLYNDETFKQPTETIDWLNARRWISAHHHVRCPRRVFKRKLLSARYHDDPNYEGPDRMSDFARLARVLTGTAVGLVLGGGGARGISHVGIIKRMLEAGIPIDRVGGTSMGAFIGAIYAEHGSIVRTTQRAREGCLKMASMWRKLLDMTYPYTSLFTGKAFNNEIQSTFGETQIEDVFGDMSGQACHYQVIYHPFAIQKMAIYC
uniref:lysophospholipase n=1 Tax=Clytia hemisphaerica TaxID=252671 RepID=A0A7M5WZ26_9CNID